MIPYNVGARKLLTQDVPFVYLFEIAGVGTAEVGFSCQKLISTTTDFGIVRNSVGTTDTLQFSGDIITLDSPMLGGGTLATFANGGDVTVQTWFNQGTQGDITQATVSLQPKLVTAGALETVSGRPTVSFDSDQLVNSNTISMTQANSWSIKIQFQEKNPVSNQIPFDSGPSGTARQIPVWYEANVQEFRYFTGSNQQFATANLNMNHIQCDLKDPNTEIHMNGFPQNPLPSGNTGLSGLTVGTRFSGSSQFKGFIQEIVAWDADKTNQRITIFNNTVSRY